jgi:hypothetical protein
MDYSTTDLARLRYRLPELEALLKVHPNSLPLRNGIAHIRSVLGLPSTVEAVDPIAYLDVATALKRLEQNGR